MDADDELSGLLAARGWARADEALVHALVPPPGRARSSRCPALPLGYRVRHVIAPRRPPRPGRGPPGGLRAVADERREVRPARAACRATRPSTTSSSRRRTGRWPRSRWSGGTPTPGSASSSPSGTHPDHRRLGLARAVNLAGLHLLRGLGAQDALVFSAATNPASEALYASVGFEAITRHRAWTTRSPEPDARDGIGPSRARWSLPSAHGPRPDGERIPGDPRRARLDGRDGGPRGRAVRRVDPARGPQLPDLGPANAAAIPALARADQARGRRDQPGAWGSWTPRRRRPSPPPRARSRTAGMTSSSRSTSTRPARGRRPTPT